MTDERHVPLSLVVAASKTWLAVYANRELARKELEQLFRPFFADNDFLLKDSVLTLRDMPSDVSITVGVDRRAIPPRLLVFSITITVLVDADDDVVDDVFRRRLPAYLAQRMPTDFKSIGIDLPIQTGSYWCPDPGAPLFGTRAQANALIAKAALAANGLTGNGVNVIVVDQGLNEAALGAAYAGGWAQPSAPQQPGTAPLDSHGMMVARNILDLAPRARLWDVPLIPLPAPGVPASIDGLAGFLGNAQALWHAIDVHLSSAPNKGGKWVLVNAWALYDRRTEWPKGWYSNDPTHFFNVAVAGFDAADRDVLFCAGNCGPGCPDLRCGEGDIGPDCSILGANSHPRTLTVAAVRCDRILLGFSSVGRGQPGLCLEKPDLVAPGQFEEDGDAGLGNVGTSAAMALAGGVVAALRQGWGPGIVSPEALRKVLRETAVPVEGPDWQPHTGHGVINAERAIQRLIADYGT